MNRLEFYIINTNILKAKKSYGQHFLTNEEITSNIANAFEGAHKNVLEVGPGKGMLTKYLLQKDYQLIVVEADRDMVSFLKKNFPPLLNHIVSADFLKVPISSLFQDEPFALIGNFPYNISSQILFKMIENKELIPEMVGMFQKEVAERVIAAPGNKSYGVLSVLVQAWYEGDYLFTVDKSNFNPPPKVQSGVIRLQRKNIDHIGCDEKLFRSVVKQAFSQRRKMLRNTMKPFLNGNALLNEPFFTQRPERLSVEDFIQLTNWIEEKGINK